jgi:hypothetical protein
MSTSLIPQVFWFRLAAKCPRVESIPSASTAGRLLEFPPSCKLPDFSELDARPTWAEVSVGWNPKGLGVSIRAVAEKGKQSLIEKPEGFAEVNLWIDTRDTRNVSRATRFCHRFTARLDLTNDRKSLTVEASQKLIARAVADAQICDPRLLVTRTELTKTGWGLELFLPAQVLRGFDPETNRRLGFAYQVADHEREHQFMGVGRDFPLGENPSLWATLELEP